MAQRLTRLMPTVRATSGNQTHRNRQLYVLARHSFAGCFCGPSPVLLRSPKPAELGIRMRAASSTDGPKNDTTISKSSKPRVIVLTGATGVGKTELSLILAESLNGEIISADSVQVYKHMDVGSDKLPLSKRRGIPHHLIDILDPLDPTAEYSAGDFHDAAHEAVSDILSRGATPIVVGGTGFYLRTFMCGKPRGGKASPAVEGRVTDIIAEAMLAAVAGDPTAATAAAAVAARLRQADGPATAANTAGCVPGSASGSGSLREKRGEVSPHGGPDATVIATAIAKAAMDAVREAAGEDAATACGEQLWGAGVETLRRAGDADGAARVALERNNWYRLQRALEIVLVTGQPTAASAAGAAPAAALYDFRPFFLHRPRLEVFRRIDERVEHMVIGGLLEEAHVLRQAGAEPGGTPATRAIGYRQALSWLADVADARACDAAAVRRLAAAIQGPTRRLQRAQLVFHRGDANFAWIDATPGPAAAAETILESVAAATHSGGSDRFGTLSKEEQEAVKRYTTQWQLLDRDEHVEAVREWLAGKGYIDAC